VISVVKFFDLAQKQVVSAGFLADVSGARLGGGAVPIAPRLARSEICLNYKMRAVRITTER
jgi:hypothetical protein